MGMVGFCFRCMMRHPLILIALLLPLLLMACHSDDDKGMSRAATTAPVTLNDEVIIRFAIYEWQRGHYETLAAAFMQDNPGIHIQLVPIRVTQSSLSGVAETWQQLASTADVINLEPDRLATQVGLLRDLTPFIEADAGFQPDDFYPGLLAQYQWAGGIWGLTTAVSYQILFYNKTAFDRASLPYPQPDWTWEDFLAAARTLTIRESDSVTQWGFVQPWPNHLPFIEGRVPLIDETTILPKPRFDQPDVITAVRWYSDLHLVHQVIPYPNAPAHPLPDGEELIAHGQAAMWQGTSARWPQPDAQVSPGVVPYPVGESGDHTTPAFGEGLSMSAGTASPEATWQWMVFVSRQPPYNPDMTQLLPARRSVAESSGFWQTIHPELAAILPYAIDHSYARGWQPIHSLFLDALNTILTEAEPVEEALAGAQIQAQAVLTAPVAPVDALTVIGVTPDPASEGEVTITFVTSADESGLDVYETIAQRFQEIYTGIQVNIKTPTVGPETRGMPEMALEGDCFQWAPSLQDPRHLAAILSLEPFLDADPTFTTDDFYPSVLAPFTAEGQLWGLPMRATPLLVEYNKALFDAADIPYPQMGWTIDEFLATAVVLTQGEEDTKQYGFAEDPGFAPTILLLMLEHAGARLIDNSRLPPSVAFDDPATIQAMRRYAALYTEYEAAPVLRNFNQPWGPHLFNALREWNVLIDDGRVAMWPRFGGQFSPEERTSEMNVGVVPLPAASNGSRGSSVLTNVGYFISAHTEERQACWLWLTFLTGQPAVFATAHGLPARRSVAESDMYQQVVGADRAAVYLGLLAEASQPTAYHIFNDEASWLRWTTHWLTRAFGRIVAGEVTVEEALAMAQETADAYRTCVITSDALSDQGKQDDCAITADPTLPDFVFGLEKVP